ncbi:MAG: hypothetical protein AAF456_03050 [Planctomycetota bacterium]
MPLIHFFGDTGDGCNYLPIRRGDLIRDFAVEPDQDVDFSQPFKVEIPYQEIPAAWLAGMYAEDYTGFFDGEYFAFGEDEIVETVPAAPPYRESLTQPTIDLINASGISIFNRFDDHDWGDTGLHEEGFTEDYLPEEKRFLEEVDAAVRSAESVAGGLTYEDRNLKLDATLSFSEENVAVSEVVNVDALARPFEPTLGLPVENLAASVSLQMGLLESPVAMQVLSKLVSDLPNVDRRETPSINGRMVRTAFELLSGTRDNLNGMRLALYRSSHDVSGEMNIIVILDSTDGDQLLESLRETVAIAAPGGEEGPDDEQRAEIAALIELLDDPKFAVRQDATSKLILAGRNALPQLRAVRNTGSLEKKSRIERVIDAWEADARVAMAGAQVEDASFWTGMRPQFSLEPDSAAVGDFSADVIRIHPDPELAAEKLANATGIMTTFFGDQWDKLHMIRIEDQFVLMLGSEIELLERTAANVVAGADPVSEQDSVANVDFEPGQFQIHVSISTLADMFIRPYVNGFPDLEIKEGEFVSVSLGLHETFWKMDVNIPVDEIIPMYHYFTADMNGGQFQPAP